MNLIKHVVFVNGGSAFKCYIKNVGYTYIYECELTIVCEK